MEDNDWARKLLLILFFGEGRGYTLVGRFSGIRTQSGTVTAEGMREWTGTAL